MVTLATAVNASATTWALSEALPDGTEYLQVDDELVAVVTPAIRASQRDDFTLFCEVQRGTAGEQEAHAQGATLTTLENPPLGGGSGEQTVRLLGPFEVAFDTAGVEVDRVAVGPVLTVDDAILDIYMTGLTPWDTTTALLTMGVVYSDASGTDLAQWDVADPFDTMYPTSRFIGALIHTGAPPGDVRIGAFVEVTGGPAAQGLATFYCLVATPA